MCHVSNVTCHVSCASKKSATYSFIDNTGLQYKLAIFKLCKAFIKNDAFPSSFDNTTLVRLPKKGSKLHLDNSRFIHVKQWLPRLVEALAVRGMKDDILSAGSKCQIGGCPGQRTQFHLFVVRSLIALQREEAEGCIITAVDINKFFDKQSLSDAMHILHKATVNKTMYKVWYKLNEKTTTQVMTGAGLKARGLAGPVMGQGGGGATLASALNLDRG